MSRQRSHTPSKAHILATVEAHPGLSSDEIAKITKLHKSSTRHILEELRARKLVYPIKHLGRVAKLWYVRPRLGNPESVELPVC